MLTRVHAKRAPLATSEATSRHLAQGPEKARCGRRPLSLAASIRCICRLPAVDKGQGTVSGRRTRGKSGVERNGDHSRVGPDTPRRPAELPLALCRLDRPSCCGTLFAAERQSPSARERVPPSADRQVVGEPQLRGNVVRPRHPGAHDLLEEFPPGLHFAPGRFPFSDVHSGKD